MDTEEKKKLSRKRDHQAYKIKVSFKSQLMKLPKKGPPHTNMLFISALRVCILRTENSKFPSARRARKPPGRVPGIGGPGAAPHLRGPRVRPARRPTASFRGRGPDLRHRDKDLERRLRQTHPTHPPGPARRPARPLTQPSAARLRETHLPVRPLEGAAPRRRLAASVSVRSGAAVAAAAGLEPLRGGAQPPPGPTELGGRAAGTARASLGHRRPAPSTRRGWLCADPSARARGRGWRRRRSLRLAQWPAPMAAASFLLRTLSFLSLHSARKTQGARCGLTSELSTNLPVYFVSL